MVRIFRNKQPSTKLAGVVYVLQEKDKSVGGTVLMLVRRPRLPPSHGHSADRGSHIR